MADVPYRILIVDDEVDFADVLCVEFTRSGFDATAVHDGTQALAAMDTAVFDAILTDILMPKMNGVAFVGLARTHRKNRNAMIFTMSGNFTDEITQNLVRLGIVETIPKPFPIGQVVGLIRRRLAARDPDQTSIRDVPTDEALTVLSQAAGAVMANYLGATPDVLRATRDESRARGTAIGLVNVYQKRLVSTVVLNCSDGFLKAFLLRLFGPATTEITATLAQQITGALVSQIAQQVKVLLAKQGYVVDVGLPEMVVHGTHLSVHVKDSSRSYDLAVTHERECALISYCVHGLLEKIPAIEAI